MRVSYAVAALVAAAALGGGGGTVGIGDSSAYGSAGQLGRSAESAAPPPAWFTGALHRQTLEAAEQGAAVPLPDDAHVPTTALLFGGIRPGSRMVWPSSCTLSYVFGRERQLSIGTAGHCAKVGQDVTIVAAPGVLLNIGTVVRSVARGIGHDFALIRIRPQLRRYVSASVTHIGGPTGKAAPRAGDAIIHAGHGLVVGYGGTTRAGIVSRHAADGFGWAGVAAPGDSGAPVRLLDGRAAGMLTHIISDPTALPTAVAGTTISRMETLAGLALTPAHVLPEPRLAPPVVDRKAEPIDAVL